MSIARQLVENLDSLEGVPDWRTWIQTAFKGPGTPENRDYRLRFDPPVNKDQAVALGVNWYMKDGKKYTFIAPDRKAPTPSGVFQNSATMSRNRNIRRKSFGYPDHNYSMRSRGWPTAIRRPDGSLRKQHAPPVGAAEPPPINYDV